VNSKPACAGGNGRKRQNDREHFGDDFEACQQRHDGIFPVFSAKAGQGRIERSYFGA
jgi:hypothetical protein